MANKPAPRYRSAKTGKYVKPGYAKSNTSTTVKETSKGKK